MVVLINYNNTYNISYPCFRYEVKTVDATIPQSIEMTRFGILYEEFDFGKTIIPYILR